MRVDFSKGDSGRLLIIILVLAFVVLTAGCESKEFKAERELWRAHKLARAVYRNPKGTPPMQVSQAQNAYKQIIQKYPNSIFAIQAQFSIGHLFLVKKDYQQARRAYMALTGDCEKNVGLCINAYFAVGKSYEVEDKWDEALSVYKKIMRDFPLSPQSLQLPIYIIRQDVARGDQAGVQRAVDEAVLHYEAIKSRTEEREGSGYFLQNLIVRSYIEGGQWQEALDGLDKLARDYPENNPENALWIKTLIYANQLKDKDKAKKEIQKILEDYPQSRLTQPLQALLEKL